jgi:transposase
MDQKNIVNRLFDLHQTNFVVRDLKVFEHKIVVEIEANSDKERICSKCRKLTTKVHDYREIILKDIPYGLKECEWRVKFSRVKCECSDGPQNEYLSFKSEKHNITKRLQDNVEFMICTKMLTVADTARIFGLNYNVVYNIDHDVLYRMVQSYKIPDPINISADEKSFKKGHSYVTVVTDTDRKKVIWVSSGNSKSSLDEFFMILGPERCSKIKTVSKDLHIPYKASCDEFIPEALQVADHFHVIQRLNQAIDDCRKELSVGSNLKIGKRKTIHRMNWLLRFKKENLSDERAKSLESLQEINTELYKAYLHKEQFFNFFTFRTYEIRKAEIFLTSWIVEAFKVKLKGLTDFAEYIARNTSVLLNIIKTGRSSAISEGINTKIGVIKAMAYGYKNIEYFKLKIMQRCGYLGINWAPA